MSLLRTLHQKLLRNTLGLTQRMNLIRLISTVFPEGQASVLDIGCGNGLFAHDLMKARPELHIVGVETVQRGESFIEQTAYDGHTLPFPDNSFDYAMLINVLHHTEDPAQVLSEAKRVARQGIIIKDHYANSRFDFYTLVAMEMIGNAFAGIHQPYHFLSDRQWGELFDKVRMKTEKLLVRFVSYNRFVDLFFGRNLHFIARMTPGA